MSILMQVDSRHFSGRLLPATAGHKAPRYKDVGTAKASQDHRDARLFQYCIGTKPPPVAADSSTASQITAAR